ncbi:hypothetical protein ACMFWY_05315 [Roseiconus sp. JC912]|uniref:hypothetical protein n=1 Tax=Roseiconus sp. JC912 TaxID=3396307 RepID=UPI003A4C688E
MPDSCDSGRGYPAFDPDIAERLSYSDQFFCGLCHPGHITHQNMRVLCDRESEVQIREASSPQ